MKLLLENWREFLSEEEKEEISVEDIHNRANELEIPWDDDTEFMAWTKELTKKSHLDDLDDDERSIVYAGLPKYGQQKAFDEKVLAGADWRTLKDSGDYPLVDSMSSDVAAPYFKQKFDWL